MSLNPGVRVSRYRIERTLGAGGMGEVYLARDLELDRLVAIKFLAAPDDARARRRLLREAQASAALDHPGICAVYEVGTDAAVGDFIVMQYVEGETLAARLRQGRLRAPEALAIIGHVAEALMVAHRAGIVHRDLKPQNIIITPTGRPKLLDFGLARHLIATAVPPDAATASETQPHALVGTPGYMAPEQIRGHAADARSDVFALGCVLYECLTGRRAFSGATSAAIFGQILHVEPPLASTIAPDLTPAHDALCARMLSKDVEERFQSTEEVLGAIRALTPSTASGTGLERAASSRDAATGRSRIAVVGRTGWIIVALVVLGVAALVWRWGRSGGLPVPPSDASSWYDRGVEALREGSYAGARASLQEAVRLYPPFAQAYSRLAEASGELDDEGGATAALLHVGSLVRDRTRLAVDDQLRLDAVSHSVLREHDQAIAAYRQLAERQPRDARGWLDVGRAEEAAGRLAAAREDYQRALGLDGQYAAAHLRLGSLQGGTRSAALASLDEAARLYRTAANAEGEAEATLRKGVLLSAIGQLAPARSALASVVEATADRRYESQRVRAKFELARVTAFEGRLSDAESAGREAVDEAVAAGLQSIAANGLIDLAGTLAQMRRFENAEAQLVRAIDLAVSHGATRTEMRGRLQQASLRLSTGKPDEALTLVAAPLRFFSDGHYLRFEATAKNVVSRADEDLERYEDASRLAKETLAFAESTGDDATVAMSLENLAGQMTKLGRLPEALAYRDRSEEIHRKQNDHTSLSFDLTNRAELLIELGRGQDAETLLAEVEHNIAAGIEVYAGRRRRVALLRALLASTGLQFENVEPLATAAIADLADKPDTTALYAIVLREHARSQLGRSRVPAVTIASWPSEVSSPVLQRELSYWVACTLAARHEGAKAYAIATAVSSAPGAQGNAELQWRLAAVAALARQGMTGPRDGASILAHAPADIQALTTAWNGQAAAYFARPDLIRLRRALS